MPSTGRKIKTSARKDKEQHTEQKADKAEVAVELKKLYGYRGQSHDFLMKTKNDSLMVKNR